MLYSLLYPLHTDYTIFNVIRYITFRSGYAALTALVISFIMGPWLIRQLKNMQMGQSIREGGPPSHQKKSGTPTMGGGIDPGFSSGSQFVMDGFREPVCLDRTLCPCILRFHRVSG